MYSNLNSKFKIPNSSSLPFVFFGTDTVAVGVLDALKKTGYVPAIIVTTPDTPAGRNLALTPPPVKLWALTNNIPVLQPSKLDQEFSYKLKAESYKLFIVASYGKIMPQKILALPRYGALNVHPSLLPKYRGPSPIQTAILNGDSETGVTIMLMDERMDEGPIVAQEKIPLNGTETNRALEVKLAHLGGAMLVRTIPDWINGKIVPRDQDHTQATYTRKFESRDGFIDPAFLSTSKSDNNEALTAFRKIRALGENPGVFTLLTAQNGKSVRLKILSATIENNLFTPIRVIPEGKKEMPWQDFIRGYRGDQKR